MHIIVMADVFIKNVGQIKNVKTGFYLKIYL